LERFEVRGGLVKHGGRCGGGVTASRVGKWRSRFCELRLEGLVDDPRPGRPARITTEQVEELLVATLESTPLVCDNYATHKRPAIRRRLEQHPHFQVHHTPPYSSQINQIERSFAYLTDDLLRRSDHRSVQALQKHIRSRAE
jgi:hypothetical protein